MKTCGLTINYTTNCCVITLFMTRCATKSLKALIHRNALMRSLNFLYLKQPHGNGSKIVAHRVIYANYIATF